MNKEHFIQNVPIHTHIALDRLMRFLTTVFAVVFLGFLIIDIPLVWDWYHKKMVCKKQHVFFTQEQEMQVQQQELKNSIKQLYEQVKLLNPKQKPLTVFLKALLENKQSLSIVSVKKEHKKISIQATGSNMYAIKSGLKVIAAETHYAISVQSIERKDVGFVFYATATAGKNIK